MKNILKAILLTVTAVLLLSGPLTARTLKFPPAQKLDLSSLKIRPMTVGLLIADDLQNFVHTEKTSPFDKLHYPVGSYSAEFFKVNLPSVFEKVVEAKSQKPAEGVDFVIVPSIIKFDAVVPHPAWKPYLASIVYRIDVYNREGNKVFTQTTTGEGQTSKGMMSGFSAGKQCTEATLAAIQSAGKQLFEGLAEAEELRQSK